MVYFADYFLQRPIDVETDFDDVAATMLQPPILPSSSYRKIEASDSVVVRSSVACVAASVVASNYLVVPDSDHQGC